MRTFTSVVLSCLIFTFSVSARADWKSDNEAGVVVTTGNSTTQSLNAKTTTDRTFAKNLLRLQGSYLRAKQSGVLSALTWSLGFRYERELSEKFSVFAGQSVEGDRFAGILQRYNTDLGGKYFFYKLPKDFIWFAEAGYRYTKEHTATYSKGFQKARLYSEAEKNWTDSTSTKLWVEYIPNFTVSQAWLFNSEPSLSSAVSTYFSIKTAHLVKYSNAPVSAALKKTDAAFTTALVAKF
ncbi:MAG: DUF481 domain-containing protein [Bdellovibrionota bacterium]